MTASIPKTPPERVKNIQGGRTFKHSGDAGDVIYSLPAVRVAGGGDFYLSRSDFTRVASDEKALANIAPLLLAQPYIASVALWNAQPIAYDLDLFRNIGDAKQNIADRHLRAFSFPETESDVAWLEVSPLSVSPVVINATARFRNPHFPWREVLERFKGSCVFVGHPTEFEAFTRSYGRLPYRPTQNLLELAEVIAGAELFIGNQSCACAIAEGLKKEIIQETFPDYPNCIFHRKQFHSVLKGYQDLPPLFPKELVFPVEPAVGGGMEVKQASTPTATSSCQTCIVQLGRYGDLLNILPVAKHIADQEGGKVAVMVQRDYVDLMDAVSYVETVPWERGFMSVEEAAATLKGKYRRIIISRLPAKHAPQERLCESYNRESWRIAGYIQHWNQLPLVLDRRNREREAQLIAAYGLADKRFILVNPVGYSSPFRNEDELFGEIHGKWATKVQVVDMRQIRAQRFHDLLGLMEQAVGLVTVDTATLHLAAAGNVRTIGLISDYGGPWFGTTPRFELALSMRYGEFAQRKEEIHAVIASWLNITRGYRGAHPLIPVTLVGVDTFMPNRSLQSLWYAMKMASFQDAKLVCRAGTKPVSGDWRGVTPIFLEIGPERIERERFLIHRLHEVITGTHCLHVEWDARILNPQMWNPEWLKYDYIGAPWPYPLPIRGFPECTAKNNVGNLGFALVSKRFSEAVAQIARPTPEEARLSDVYICRTLRPQLEKMGMEFAPEDVAERFSCEGRPFSGNFGGHGKGTFQLNNIRL